MVQSAPFGSRTEARRLPGGPAPEREDLKTTPRSPTPAAPASSLPRGGLGGSNLVLTQALRGCIRFGALCGLRAS